MGCRRAIGRAGESAPGYALRALFGLGGVPSPVTVEVQLLGKRWRYPGIAADRYTTLVLDEAHVVRN